MEMTVRYRKFQLVWGLFDDSAENIVIHTEYRLKVSTIHIVSDQTNGVEHYAPELLLLVIIIYLFCFQNFTVK